MTNIRKSIFNLVENSKFQWFIIAVIILNAISLGVETTGYFSGTFLEFLHFIDEVALSIFVIELSLKLFAHGFSFFKRSWNIFDFVIVGVCLIPFGGNLSVLRALRVLRVLRLISVLPQLRLVVNTFVKSLPGVGSVMILFSVIFYVFVVMSVQLFSSVSPEHFGTMTAAMFTLFQFVTLEGWSDIVRGIMEVYPWAGLFFVIYILVATFVLLNMIIAVILNVMADEEIDPYSKKLDKLEKEIKALTKALKSNSLDKK